MQRPPVVAVRNIAPNNAQITNAQFIKPNQQQQLLRAQNTAFPLTLNPNSAINPQFMVAKNDQGQMFLVPPTGQNSLVQLQTQTLQPQNALQAPTQRSVGQIIKPLSGQVIVVSTNVAASTTTRPVLVQTPQEQQVQTASASQAVPRTPQPINQRLLPSSTPSQQQVKAPSLVVLQATQAQQQQAIVRPIQLASSTPVTVSQAAALPNDIDWPASLSAMDIDKLHAIAKVIQDKEIMANVKKCKNFLSTLLKLAANQPPETSKNVYVLIQGLIDGKVTPEQFTAQLQKELKSSPQPNLIPFLKQSLPYLRQCMLMNKMQIDGIRPPATSSAAPQMTSSATGLSMTPRLESGSPLVEQLQTSAFSENATVASQTGRLQSPQATQSPQLTKQQAASLLTSLVTSSTSDLKQVPPVLVASQQFIRAGIRPNQIQVQVQQQLQQPLNRLQLHQLVQQPAAQQIVTAMQQGASNFIAQNQPSNLPRFIISQNALLQNAGQAANGSQSLPTGVSSSHVPQNNVASGSLTSAATPAQKGEKRKYDAMRDDDDIMDVAAMGGVNLNEETKNILAHTSQLSSGQMRSCKDELFLNEQSLAARIQNICQAKGLTFSPDVLALLSHSARDRHATLIAQLDTVTSHRLQIYKNDDNMVLKNEVRRQLKFRQDVARLEGERAKEQESKAIIKAAKSRTKSDDPEQLKKKELAKKQQQQEMEDKVKEQSNLTALAAIGPRRQKTGGLLGTPGVAGPGVASAAGLLTASQSLSLRARVKRATLKDMLHVMESDKHLRNTPLYYKVSYGMIP